MSSQLSQKTNVVGEAPWKDTSVSPNKSKSDIFTYLRDLLKTAKTPAAIGSIHL